MAFPKVGVEMVVEGYGDFQSKLGKMGKGIAGVGKAAGKIALGGMAVLGTATVALGAGFIKLASDAASLEGIRDAFAGIAQSAGTSQEAMLAALKKGSLGMVTQRDLMATFNEAAQLVGTTFATQLPDAFGYLSKVSAATGQDMGFMIDSLVKGVGRMSPMILDNLGIQVTLADATANAAEQFGVEADELSKTQLQTGMMNVVLEKLAENTAAMPEVAGTAAQAQAAFGVALKDTKDAIGLALLPAFTSLMKIVTTFATDNLPKLVAIFQDKIGPAITGVVDAFGWLGEKISWVISGQWGVLDLFRTFEDGSSVMRDFFEKLGFGTEVAETVSEAINKLAQFLGENIPKAIQTASDFWTDTLQPALEDVANFILDDVIPAIEDVVGFLIDRFNDAVDWVETNWPDIQETIEDVMDAIEDIVETVLDAVADFWDTHGAKILDAAETHWNSIKTAIETVINTVKGIITAVMQAISGDWEGAWNTIKGVIETIWEGIKTIIGNAFTILKDTIIPIALDAIKNLITTAWNALKDVDIARIWEGIKQVVAIVWTALVETVIPTALTAIKTLIEAAWNFLKDTLVPALWDGIKMAIKLVWYALVNTVIPTALDAVESLIETAWNYLKDTLIPGIWDAIVSIIETAWEDIKEFVQTGIDTVVDIVEGVADAMYNAGKAIVENIKQGIADKWGELVSWFKDKLSALAGLLPWSEPKITSPLSNLAVAGAGIVLNIMAGMESEIPAMMDMGAELGDAFIDAMIESLEEGERLIDQLFEAGGVFGGLGGMAAGMFEEQTLDPLKNAMKGIQDTIKETLKYLKDQRKTYADITEEMDKMFANLLDQTKHTEMLADLAEDRLDAEEKIAELGEKLAELPAIEAAEREKLLDQLEDQRWKLEKMGDAEEDLRREISDTTTELAGLAERFGEEERERRTEINELLENQQSTMEEIVRDQSDLSREIADTQAELAGLGAKYAEEEAARREKINELLDDQQDKLIDLAFAERDLREGYAAEIKEIEEINKLRAEAGELALELPISLEGLMEKFYEDPLQLTTEQYNIAKRLNRILESRADTQETIIANEQILADLALKYQEAEAEERDILSRSLDQQLRDMDALARKEIRLSDDMAATRQRLAELTGELTAEEEAERLELQNQLMGYYTDLEDLQRRMAALGKDATDTERELLQLAVDYAQQAEELRKSLIDRRNALTRIAVEEERIKAALEAQGTFHELMWNYLNDQSKLTEEQIAMIDEYLRLQAERAGLTGDIADGEAYLAQLQREQAELAEEYRKEQERILALEKARKDLKFLEEQLKLLDLIAEHGLDAEEILGGMTLGVDASLEDMIEAMTSAIQAIIGQAEEDLGISSPSTAFQSLGEEMMAGMAMGIEQMANLPIRASLLAAQQTISIPALSLAASPASQSTSNEYNYHLGGNTIASGMDQAQFEARVLRIVRRDAKT